MSDNSVPNSNGNTAAEKHARGRELLESRTNTALDKLRTIGNVSAKTYGILPPEYGAAISALRAEVDRIESMFVNGKPQTGGFSLAPVKETLEPKVEAK